MIFNLRNIEQLLTTLNRELKLEFKVWQYQDGGWHDYDPRGSDEVEQTYQLYEKEKATGRIIDVRSVRSGAWEYQVDFRQFTQQNVRHEAHTVRAIRRIWRSM